MDVEHPPTGVDAIHRALVDARLVENIDTWLGDDVRHRLLLRTCYALPNCSSSPGRRVVMGSDRREVMCGGTGEPYHEKYTCQDMWYTEPVSCSHGRAVSLSGARCARLRMAEQLRAGPVCDPLTTDAARLHVCDKAIFHFTRVSELQLRQARYLCRLDETRRCVPCHTTSESFGASLKDAFGRCRWSCPSPGLAADPPLPGPLPPMPPTLQPRYLTPPNRGSQTTVCRGDNEVSVQAVEPL